MYVCITQVIYTWFECTEGNRILKPFLYKV